MAGPRGHEPGSANEGRHLLALEGEAQALADRLPDLCWKLAHRHDGRAWHPWPPPRGTGETFWQFRQFQAGERAHLIDWRRSASSDHLYVREREWEAAHTFWLWPDLSPSMSFRSHLAPVTKRDRALVLTLAAAELLVRAGERVALLALTRRWRAATPPPHRRNHRRQADARSMKKSLPPNAALNRFSGAMLFSDFLGPPATSSASGSKGSRGRCRRSYDPDARSRRRNAGLQGPHRISAPGRRGTLGRRPGRDAASQISASFAAHRAELAKGPSASAGRSSCITPTVRRRSRCWRC